jgi:hypothetical protein
MPADSADHENRELLDMSTDHELAGAVDIAERGPAHVRGLFGWWRVTGGSRTSARSVRLGQEGRFSR